MAWRFWCGAAFMRAYLGITTKLDILPSEPEEIQVLLDMYRMDKAVLQLEEELGTRPDFGHVPLLRMRRILESSGKSSDGRSPDDAPPATRKGRHKGGPR